MVVACSKALSAYTAAYQPVKDALPLKYTEKYLKLAILRFSEYTADII